MKKIFLFAVSLFIFITTVTKGQTIIPSGIVRGTWTLAGSPYLIQGTVQIPNDSTLIIEPGVTVDFQGAYKLNVQGRLLAIGNASDSITFIATNNSNGLRGIRFDNTPVNNDTSKIEYCKLKYGAMDYALYLNNFSKAIISNCNISHCSGYNLAGGGGIYCYNSSPRISYNLISYNSASGIYLGWDCGWNCSPIVLYNTISNNSNSGIYCSQSHAIISNNIITNNSGGNGGGISCNDYSAPIISNNVITNNSAFNNGGGIYFKNTNTNINPFLYNTIIWGNTASNGGAQVFLGDEENDPNFYYCDIQGGSAAFDLNGNTYIGAYINNININPLFAAPSGGVGASYNGIIADWSLQNNSPCINTGDPFDTLQIFHYPTLDIAGNPRVTVCRIDIGAYEYQNGIPLAISLNISQPIYCNGEATGAIAVSVSGGTSPYTYLWNNGGTTANISSLIANNYTVTVSEVSGCSITKSITLSQPTPIAVDAGTSKTIICDGLVQLGAQPKWVTLNSGITAPLYSVFFISPDTGYAVGGFGGGAAIILKTINGGASWIAQTCSPVASRLYSVYFTNANTGYAVGDHGIILKTIDGGINWGTQAPAQINFLQSIFFVNNNIGYACGQGVAQAGGIILKTIDGGVNWTALTSGTSFTLTSIYFIDPNTGYAVGNNATLLKTIDGGLNWTVQPIGNNYNFYNLSSVYFSNANTGYISGGNNNANGMILKTVDGGINWTAIDTLTTNAFNSIYLPDVNTVYAAGSGGVIQKTINAGTNWNRLTSGTTHDLNAVCFPNINTGYAVGNNGTILKLSGQFSFKWSPATGLTNDSISNPIATMINDSKYFVTATTPEGCTTIDSVMIIVNPLTINGTDRTILCGDSTVLNTTTNYNGTGLLTYSWLPSTGLNSTGTANPSSSVHSNQIYTVAITTPNGCVATDNINVALTPMNAIEICIVGVDNTNKNRIVWNKPASAAIDSFYIYRETNITNMYQKIGSVSYDSLSVFGDINSHPDVQSNKYKISIKDNCGLESNISASHKTMHLSINQGQGSTWNLIWDAYEGFTVSTYNVYKGTTSSNLQLIGTSSGSNTQYSDLNAPSGYLYYQVEVISPNNCNPTRSYNSSRSNIASNTNSGVAENDNATNLISIYPNPAQDKIYIKANDMEALKRSVISIFNMEGEEIMNLQFPNQDINVSTLSSGIYTLKIQTEKNVIVKRFTKQ